jgi:hemerythrin superfamily protein
MDAITLLKNDHKSVEQLFKRFEKAGERAHAEKRKVVDRILEELSVHAAIEEQYFYPVVRATVPDTESVTLESLEEHHLVKMTLAELDKLDPSDERFDAKVTVLIENVRHHVKEEEKELFPKVREELGRAALSDLGETLEAAKANAPTKPHPAAPDTPPANAVIGLAAGAVDRVGDTVSGVAQGAVMALGDLIDLILRRKKSRPGPSGSSVSRSSANRVRKTVNQGAKTADQTARTARAGAKRTARTAKRGAEATARTGRSAAKKVASTARGR